MIQGQQRRGLCTLSVLKRNRKNICGRQVKSLILRRESCERTTSVQQQTRILSKEIKRSKLLYKGFGSRFP